jgi:DNA-binding NarL/FixJ family response regulator
MMTRIRRTSRVAATELALRSDKQRANKTKSAEVPRGRPIDCTASIIIIDKRALFRDCLARCLESTCQNYCVISFPSIAEWLACANARSLPVVLLVCVSEKRTIDPDVRRELAQLAARKIDPPTLIVSDAEDLEGVAAQLERSVQGCLSKNRSVKIGMSSTHFAGGRPPQEGTGEEEPPGPDTSERPLSNREMAVLMALRQGKRNKQIAGELRVRQGTVKVHVRKIMRTLHARNRTEVAALADHLLAGEPQAMSSDRYPTNGKERSMLISTGKLRLVIVDPQKLRQAGLVRLLEGWADANGLELATFATPEESDIGPDCAIVVFNVGGASVREQEWQVWIKCIRAAVPDVPLAILSDRDDRNEILAAFGEGVTGFIATSFDPPLAFEALSFLLHGGSFFPLTALIEEPHARRPEDASIAIAPDGGEATTAPFTAWQAPEHQPAEDAAETGHQLSLLTPRQNEVLKHLREGKSNKLIARELKMTEATVKVHVRQIMRKVGAVNRTQAVLRAAHLSTTASQDTSS